MIRDDDKLYLVIRTNSYTGNFERELMAYVFGIDESDNYADEELELFKKETPQFVGDVDELYEYYDQCRWGRFDSEYYGYMIERAPEDDHDYECNCIYMAMRKKFPDDLFNLFKERLEKFTEREPGLKILDVGYYEIKYQRLN